MMKNKFEEYEYTINNRPGFGLTDALRLWKTKYSDIRDFDKEVITHEGMYPFRDFVHEMWENIEPVTVQEALAVQNTEERRTYFDCIGVEKLFKELQPTLRDKQVIKKKRTRWDDNNDQYQYEFEDVYELYELDGTKLYETDRWGRAPQPVFAVRCWCTTTNREYWIYVNEEAATGRRQFFWPDQNKPMVYDAIRAIAWTIRLDVSHPERIYRQGDIIVAKISRAETESSVQPYHLSKEQYLNLMYSET
jgi:hypothetical protein